MLLPETVAFGDSVIFAEAGTFSIVFVETSTIEPPAVNVTAGFGNTFEVLAGEPAM